MRVLTIAVLAATPTPTAPPVDPDLVTPGPWGFAAVVFMAVAVILLVWDMLRRIRRARYRAEIGAQLDAELAEQSGDAGPDASSGPSRPGGAPPAG
ncbi:MAG: hypothetical protein QM611_10120 [Microbacterium sp.]|uniref:hypothetical protein n=1 Tax=Microbacterium sp. TaxID=51671 RepID=UPI0039E3467C